MTQAIQKKLNDSAFARWTALILVALTMFFGYMFVDMMSPLQSMIEAQRGWTPDVFGMYGSSEFILNVFGFLILAGIILDKMGVRFTGQLSASLMFIGACLKYYAVSDSFAGSGIETWLGSWWTSFPASAKLASLGFMIFGCGMEMAGITVSKAIAKWFEGKEMALAMGLEMAIARVGVFAIFSISPWLADMAPATVVRPVAFCTVLLLIGLLTFVIFSFMDRKLDKQLGLDSRGGGGSEEEFKVSDLKYILSSKVFWIIAFLCVLYYSAIFPFQRFATNMLESNLGVSAQTAADIFRWFPMGAAAITPFLGRYLDHKGKAAREEGVKLLIEKIHEIAGKKAPAIVGGDFNTPVDSPIFKPLTKYMVSARAKAATTDHKGTFNGFGSAPDTIVIDHLYYRGKLKCQLFATLDGNYGAPYISDHYPIAMVFTL